MAQRNVSAFKTTKNSRYADNTAGDVSAADSRDMFEDVADSVVFLQELATPSTGTAIAFDKFRSYGVSSPETGNITLNSAGLLAGVTQLVIHNNSSEPTFGAEFKIISGAYVTGEDNYIFCHAVSSSLILVTISQEL